MEHPPFYGKKIARAQEQSYIEKILEKHRDRPVDEILQKEVYDELMHEKHLGNITIPFKVLLKRHETGSLHLEVLLDTKV